MYSLDPGDTATAMRARAWPGKPPEDVPAAADSARAYLMLLERGLSGDEGGGFMIRGQRLHRYR